MSTELQPLKSSPPAGAAAESTTDTTKSPGSAEPEEEGFNIIVLILLSPFLLVLFILLFVVWLFLLPFRPCMHHHRGDYSIKPTHSSSEDAGADEGWFQSKTSGCQLYYRRYIPAASVPLKGVVFASHGFGEHCNRAGYKTLAAAFTAHGYVYLALDHVGHGLSTGDRAFYESIRDVAADFIQYMEIQNDNFPAHLPRIIFGHSMGGLVAISAATTLTHPHLRSTHPTLKIRALCVSAPCLGIDPKLATPTLKFAAKILSNIFPKLILKGLPASYISRNAEAVKAYETDPLVWHGGARARVGAEMLNEMHRVLRPSGPLAQFELPFLIQHGENDLIVPVAASKCAFKRVGTSAEKKKLIIYPGGYHEPFEDEQREQFTKDLLEFIDQYTAVEPLASSSSAAAAATATVTDSHATSKGNAQNGRSTPEAVTFHTVAE